MSREVKCSICGLKFKPGIDPDEDICEDCNRDLNDIPIECYGYDGDYE